MSRYKGRALGTIGHLGTYSFHETKNISSGEGGALLVNDARFAERAEMLREKGTNRSQFFRGQVDKYTWVDQGSSYLPSELIAAFLHAQVEEAESITRRRLAVWNAYHALLAPLEEAGLVRRPIVPEGCQHNGHMYYILVESLAARTRLIEDLKAGGVNAVFHYVPLHSAPYAHGRSRAAGELPVTERQAERLLRLPLWLGMQDEPELVVAAISSALRSRRRLSSAPVHAPLASG